MPMPFHFCFLASLVTLETTSRPWQCKVCMIVAYTFPLKQSIVTLGCNNCGDIKTILPCKQLKIPEDVGKQLKNIIFLKILVAF